MTHLLDRIVTGDARELAREIPDGSVDLVLTDPPFGIGYKFSNGYEDRPEEYEPLLRWLIADAERALKPGGLAFFFQATPRLKETWGWFPPSSRLFVAAKNFVQYRRSVAVQYAFDPAVFWRKEGGSGAATTGRDWHVATTSHTMNRGLNEVGFHNCPRPLDTILYMVENFCPPRGIVLDYCIGSGTTGRAAILSGRRYIGFEIDPDTAERARERVANTPMPLFTLEPEEAQEVLAL